MPLECRYGLFVGVDRYAKLPPSERLPLASVDASALYDYFRRACPRGYWRKLISTRNKAPRQVEILAALMDFVKRVPPREPGLFYFSGHASTSMRGLVLKSYDAYDQFPSDTGLRLARVLEIVKETAGQGKHFLIVLDCCRDSPDKAMADDIPANTCILYASGQGSPAYETSKGGVLTRSLIESLDAAARENRSRLCSMRVVCNRLTRQVFAWRPASALAVELHGNRVDQFLLPVAQPSVDSQQDSFLGPTTVVRYCFGTEKEYLEGFQTLGARIFHWYGIPHNSKGGREFVREHFETPNRFGAESELSKSDASPKGMTNYFFQVRMPDRCSQWTSSDFLMHLVETPLRVPETIIFHWPYRIDYPVFKELRYAVAGEWVGGRGDDHALMWTYKRGLQEYRGLAWITVGAADTTVCLRCESLDSHDMPLYYLLPSLRDVYDLLQSIRHSTGAS
jgi:hypothetical protein